MFSRIIVTQSSLSGLVCSCQNPTACPNSWTTIPNLSQFLPIEMAWGPFPRLPTNEQQLKKVIDNIFNHFISFEFPAKIIIVCSCQNPTACPNSWTTIPNLSQFLPIEMAWGPFPLLPTNEQQLKKSDSSLVLNWQVSSKWTTIPNLSNFYQKHKNIQTFFLEKKFVCMFAFWTIDGAHHRNIKHWAY